MSNIKIPFEYVDNVDRALHNLYREKRTTLHPMLAIPIYYRRMFIGDKFNFRVAEALLQSQPTIAPLMANWRLRFEWYFDSDANRYGWIDNNTRLTPEEVMTRRHHTFQLPSIPSGYEFNTEDYYAGSESGERWLTKQISRHSLCDFAGIAPGYVNVGGSDDNPTYGQVINLDFHLTYLNIIRNYHCNRQFPNIPYVSGFSVPFTSLDSFSYYDASKLDTLFMMLRTAPNGINFIMRDNYEGAYIDYGDIPSWWLENPDYASALHAFGDYLNSSITNFGGLFCTQYEPDLYCNLLKDDRTLLKSTVQVTNGGFTVETFRLQNHLQHLYDILFVSGGRSRDLSRSRWGIKSNRQYDIPELICVNSEIIGTNLITANNSGSAGGRTTQPGDLSGNINTRRNGSRKQSFTAKTSGSLMCIVSLTPIVDYSQNIERHLLENNFEDEFTPQMARKGFELVPKSDYCVLPSYYYSNDDNSNYIAYYDSKLDSSVGKQVAWLREMTDTNRVHGEFSNGGTQEDWVLKRRYAIQEDTLGQNWSGIHITPYGNPLEWQYPFVTQTLLDPNFYLQVAFDVRAYRPIGRRFMPTIGV